MLSQIFSRHSSYFEAYITSLPVPEPFHACPVGQGQCLTLASMRQVVGRRLKCGVRDGRSEISR